MQICKRYVAVFNSFIALTDQAEETMIFSKYVPQPSLAIAPDLMCAPSRSLMRLRQELSKLIVTHTDKQTDPAAKARALCKFYEQLLQGLSVRSSFLSCCDYAESKGTERAPSNKPP